MLISCEFRFGIVVVGSDSMTGSINRGDAIIYERLKSVDELKVGEVIIFKYNGIRTIHRIIEIKAVNGEYRYITKGDANKEADNDYRLLTDVEGLVKMKIRSIGKPTLWLRSRFNA
jgi:signal peptidase I